MTIAEYDPKQAQADRDKLAEEWIAKAPSTAEEVAEFYRTAEHLAEDLDNFHKRPFRQRFQDCLVHVVGNSGASCVIDIGSGSGHDLERLSKLTAEEWPTTEDAPEHRLVGVEPNDALRDATAVCLGIQMASDIQWAPIEDADVLNCIDVLEHVPDPEEWLGVIAQRAKLGCTLIETCSTFDLGTPLHLAENRGWHPGRVLERCGWAKLAEENMMRVWIKAQSEPIVKSTLVICSGREISGQTFDAVMAFVGDPGANDNPWRVSRASENGLLRARSIWASKWWRETNGDCFLFVDSDIQFTPQDVEMVAEVCREKRSVVVGAYSVRDGGHLALRGRDNGPSKLLFGPTREPVEIEYGASGFMCIHRDVLDAMIPTLPLCHANQPWALWPLFDFQVVPDKAAGGFNWLSEDWEFPVAPDTRVLGADWRWRPLDTYQPGDRVMAVDEQSPPFSSRRYRQATVERTIEKHLPLWRIVTDEQEIITTGEHPWLTLRNWRADVRGPHNGERIGPPAKWSWTPTDALRVGDDLAGVVPQIDNPVEDEDYMTGYLQGLWHSDGTLSRDNRRGLLRMCDVEAIDRAHEFHQAVGIAARHIKTTWWTANPNHRPLHGIAVNDKSAAEKLGSLMDYNGIPSESFARGYLAGMFDGDGTHDGGSLGICNTSDVLKSRVVEAGHMLGMDFRILPKYALMNGQENIHKFWMATTPAIQRKVLPLGQMGNDGVRRMREVKHRPVTVRSIEQVGRSGDVACLTTSTGTFVADGLASHNCRRARELGFATWLDPRVILMHYGVVPWTVLNMSAVRQAVTWKPEPEQIEADQQEMMEEEAKRNGQAQPAANREARRAVKRRNGKH